MALKLSHPRTTNSHRALYPNAYFRIYEVNINKNDNQVRINMQVFADKDARDYVEPGQEPGRIYASPIGHDSASVALADYEAEVGANEVAKAYNALKDHVEKFELTEDC